MAYIAMAYMVIVYIGTRENLDVVLCGTHSKSVLHGESHLAKVFGTAGYATASQTDWLVQLGAFEDPFNVLSYSTHQIEYRCGAGFAFKLWATTI